MGLDRLQFRPAEPADAEAIVLLTEQATAARKGDPIPSHTTRFPAIDRNRELLAKASTWSRLVFAGSTLVGLAVGKSSTDAETDEVIPGREHLDLLMIDPEYWGHGIGGALLDWVDSEMASRGVETVDLWTEEANVRSRALYERKGYAASGIERDHPLFGDHQLQYEKSIS